MSEMPRMRTAEGVLAELRAADPETGVSLNLIRGIIKSELVPVVRAGRRNLVSVDAVMAFLERGCAQPVQYGHYARRE